MVTKYPTISVVIATYMREEPLVATIQGLQTLEYDPFEIVVVDQSPEHEPETERFLQEAQSQSVLRWIRTPIPNLSRARNIGIRETMGEIVVFVDDDVRFPCCDYLQACASGYANPDVVGVGGPAPWKDETDLRPLSPQFFVDGSDWHVKHLTPVEDAPWFFGCNMSFRRPALEAVGSFDEFFVGGVGDDTDMCVRVRRLGKLVYDPRMMVLHLVSMTGGIRHITYEHLMDRAAQRYYIWLKHLERRVGPRSHLYMFINQLKAEQSYREFAPESYRHLNGSRFYVAFLRGWLRGLRYWQRSRNLLD